MLEAYSTNVSVATNSAVPFNNISIQKGKTTELTSVGTVQLNKCGIYMIKVDAAGIPTSEGVMSIQLSKDGSLQPQAQSAVTGTTSNVDNLSFTSLVQVKEDNTCNCCTSPTVIRIVNTGVPATYNIANIVVTKIC